MTRTLAGLLVLAAVAAADVIYVNGRAFARGVKVVDEAGEKVVYVDKSLKERSFPKRLVDRVVKKRSDVHEYFDRYEAAEDADAVMALAAWAAEAKFKRPVVDALHRRALELDPAHADANRAVGNVEHEGEWMTPAERDRRVREAEEAAMRAKGLVRWKDRWVTPEDKAKLEQGLRKHDGRWMTEDQIKEAQGLVELDGKWVRKDRLEVVEATSRARKDTGLGARLGVVTTDHVIVMGDLPPAQLDDLAKTMERLVAEFERVLPDARNSDLLAGRYRLYAFRKAGPYRRFVRARFDRLKQEGTHSKRWLQEEERRMKLRMRETSFWEVQPYPISAHVQMPDPFEALKSHCVHFGANVLAWRYSRTRFMTWWLTEGIGYYFEKKVTGTIQTYSSDIGAAKYAQQGPVDPAKNPWVDASKWPALLSNLVRTGRDPKLDRMKGKNLHDPKNLLKAPDLAKALTVVAFLIQDDVKTFREFMHAVKNGGPSDPIEREVSAVIKHYGSYRKLEERWKVYALNGYRIAR